MNGALGWLWETTWQASALVLLVLAAQRVFRQWLTPGWRYSMWGLVVVRPCLPVLPESSFSVFNLIAQDKVTIEAVMLSVGPSLPLMKPSVNQVDLSSLAFSSPPLIDQAAFSVSVDAIPPTRKWDRAMVVTTIWLSGAGVSLAFMMVVYLSTRRRIIRLPVIEDERTLRILGQAQKALGLRRRIRLLEADDATGPVLFGLWQTRLVLPRGLAAEFSDEELRHIFLHECAHLRRHDLGLNWLIAVLQTVHWFNPVLWWAFRRLRSDRELACDALALNVTAEPDAAGYGRTIVRLLERTVSRSLLPGMVGIAEHHSNIKERISLIAALRKRSHLPIVALTLMLAMALGTLTDGVSAEKDSPAVKPKQEEPKVGTSPKSPAAILALIRDGKSYFQLRKYDKAKARLKEALKIDPKNEVTNRYLRLIEQAEYDAAVGNNLNRIRRSPLPTANPYYANNSQVPFRMRTFGGVQSIRQKLNEIIIPKFQSKGLSLDEVVVDLIEQVKRNDPEKKGLNFLISSGVPTSNGSVLDAQGNPTRGIVETGIDLIQVKIDVELPLFDLKLEHVLDAIIKTADQPIKYIIEEYAVVFVPKLLEHKTLFARIFKVDPNTFVTELLKMSPTGNIRLEQRIEGQGTVLQLDDDGLLVNTGPKNLNPLNQVVREFFVSAGVRNLGTSAGAEATQVYFNHTKGLLLVKATLQGLDVVQQVIELMHAPPRINLDVRHARVPAGLTLRGLPASGVHKLTASGYERVLAGIQTAMGEIPPNIDQLCKLAVKQAWGFPEILGNSAADRPAVSFEFTPLIVGPDSAFLLDGRVGLEFDEPLTIEYGKSVRMNLDTEKGETAVYQLPSADGNVRHLIFVTPSIISFETDLQQSKP